MDAQTIGTWASIIGIPLAIILAWWKREDIESFLNKILPKRKIIAYFDKYQKTELGKQYITNNHINSARIKKVYSSMKELVKNKKTEELDSDIYYLYLFSLLTGAEKRIWAISVMGDEEWVDTSEETEFQRLNMLAAERKDGIPIRVQRIFLVDENTVSKLKTTTNVVAQIKSPHLHTYIVNQNDISVNLLREIGSGFLAFDEYAVAEDVFAVDDIRGKLFTDTKTIKRYEHYFTQLKTHAREINADFLT